MMMSNGQTQPCDADETGLEGTAYFCFLKSYIEEHEKRINVTLKKWWEKVPKTVESNIQELWRDMSIEAKSPYISLAQTTRTETVTKYARYLFQNKCLVEYQRKHPTLQLLVANSCPKPVREFANKLWNAMSEQNKAPYVAEATEAVEQMKKENNLKK